MGEKNEHRREFTTKSERWKEKRGEKGWQSCGNFGIYGLNPSVESFCLPSSNCLCILFIHCMKNVLCSAPHSDHHRQEEPANWGRWKSRDGVREASQEAGKTSSHRRINNKQRGRARGKKRGMTNFITCWRESVTQENVNGQFWVVVCVIFLFGLFLSRSRSAVERWKFLTKESINTFRPKVFFPVYESPQVLSEDGKLLDFLR